MTYSEELSQRIQDCRELYLKHGGKKHELIEQEMRYMGYHDFHRRILYRRFERGTCTPGWIETYGWDYLLKLRNADRGSRNEEEAGGGFSTGRVLPGQKPSVKERAVSEEAFQNERDSQTPTNPQSAFRNPRSAIRNWKILTSLRNG